MRKNITTLAIVLLASFVVTGTAIGGEAERVEQYEFELEYLGDGE